MPIAQSRVTAQGQISVPAQIRKSLGIGPGSILNWEQEGDKIVIRRAASYSSKDIHAALFPDGPPRRRSLAELKEGIREYVRKRYARG